MAKKKQQDSPGGGTFEVLASFHEEGIGGDKVRYEVGETFDSDKALDELFANKFRRVGGKTARPRDRDTTINESGGKMGDRPEHARTTMARKTGFGAKAKAPKDAAAKVRGRDVDFEEDEELEEAEGTDREEEENDGNETSGFGEEEPEEGEEPRRKKSKKKKSRKNRE